MTEKMHRVKFPNSLGGEKPAASDVAALRVKLGFSSALADFLTTQNGFAFRDRDRAEPGWLDEEATVDESTPGPDLSELYALEQIASANTGDQPFLGLATIFGSGYGGDEYAEVLVGALRGQIVNLNHEMCGGASTLREVGEGVDDFTDFTEEDFYGLEPAAQADILFGAADLDLAWVIAPSLEEFLARCIYFCPTHGTGKTVPVAPRT